MNAMNLMLDNQEQAYLRGLLEADLAETRVEERRTDTPDYHDDLRKREKLIRNLLGRLRGEMPVEAGVTR